METISYTLGDTKFCSTLEGLNPGRENFVYGGFTVNPGEIVYIGNIDLNSDTTSRDGMIVVYDNYQEVVSAFYKKYPEFSKYPVKKQLFDPNGSLK